MRALLRAAALLLALATSAEAQPPGNPFAGEDAPAEDGPYRDTIRAALDELAAGRHAEALALFRRAHRLQPSARTYRGIAMAAFELADYVGAHRNAAAALEDPRRPLDGALREQTEALRRRASTFLARVTLEGAEGATVRVDGVRWDGAPDAPVLVPLGRHVIRVERPGAAPFEEALVVRGGEAPVIRVPPADGLGVDGVVDRADPDGDPDGADPDGAADRTERADASDAREADEGPGGYALPSGAAPPARPSRASGIALVTLGAASLAGSAVSFGWFAERRRALDACDGVCLNDDAIQRQRRGALGLALGLLVAAPLLAVWGLERIGKSAPASRAAWCGPTPTRAGAGFGCAGRF